MKHQKTIELDQGVILAWVCAGASCWFEEGVTDSLNNILTILCGL